jgi:hypothetical protein
MAREPRVYFDINLANDLVRKAAVRGVRAATIEGLRIVQVDILSSDPPRTGRLYKRGKKKLHQASAPGEAPAPDTGQLRNMTKAEFLSDPVSGYALGKVVNNLAKAADLEIGTDKIAPRPWISRLLGGEYRARLMAAFASKARL